MRALALGLLAEHADVDLGVPQVGRRLDAGDRDEPDARVFETLGRDDRRQVSLMLSLILRSRCPTACPTGVGCT